MVSVKHLNLRRVLHQCVDLVLDALEEDECAEEVSGAKPKRPRAFARPAIELPPDVTNEEREAMRTMLEKQGYERKRQSDA